jgi:hypothetical protein
MHYIPQSYNLGIRGLAWIDGCAGPCIAEVVLQGHIVARRQLAGHMYLSCRLRAPRLGSHGSRLRCCSQASSR